MRQQIAQRILVQEVLIDRLLIALLADGHLLVEGAPGLAKTRAIKVLSDCIEGDFHRVQFTPDLLPADLTGTDIFRPQDGSFHFQRGPLFHNLILADEINRAPAKVQSALLDAMAERQIPVGTTTYTLPKLFLVMAPPKPIEQEGTYPLPEAQMDRFLFKVVMTSPKPGELREIMQRTTGAQVPVTHSIFEGSSAPKQIETLKTLVREVIVAEPLERYAIAIIGGCTPNGPGAVAEVSQYLRFGPSPRGARTRPVCR